MEKRLYRSNSSTIIGGVCGGLGEYFEVDPAFIRILAVLLFFAKGIGLLAYIVAWIIIPRRPLDIETPKPANGEYRFANWHKYIPGIALIGLGAILLMRNFWYWISWTEIFSVLLILVGLSLILTRYAGKNEHVKTELNGNHMNGSNGGPGA
ncbi:MAG: PspC domain-containing protein [candidate division Zixibacteria bacterium]|jgi:phage shock protein PspC (stress-responsive transcriptional regulator)|nr:PspC domain-containing protein [candidate division Zixibacteria bacterium]